jgi:hypothetical protein
MADSVFSYKERGGILPSDTTSVKKAKATPDDQVKRFRKAARELGCDESEERFQEALRTVAKHKPKEPKPKKTNRVISRGGT